MLNSKYILQMLELAPTNPTGASTHQEANFAVLLEPKLRKLFYETYDELPEQYSQVFHVQTSKKAMETDFGLGAMPVWNEFGTAQVGLASAAEGYGIKGSGAVAGATGMPSVNYVTIAQGLARTYVHKEFAQGFMVERKFVDDEMYNVIEKMPKDLARSGRYKVETDAAGLFNNAFTNAIYDTKALLADNHPLVNTTVIPAVLKSDGTACAAGTASNLITGGLSDTNLKLAMVKMRQTPDEGGKLIQYKADTLVVPPQLEFAALELIKSAQKVGTTDNDINTIQGRLKVVVLDFLTNSNAWFVMDSKRHQLNFFWRVKPEFKRDEDFDTLVAKYRGYMRYSFGVSDWRGIIGSQG